jgi:phage terminase large subunit
MWLPHDSRAKTMATGRSVEELMIAAGKQTRIVPNLSIFDGINAARTIFNRCYFDEQKCSEGLQALRHYRYDIDPDSRQLSGRPLHDWASHGADAFRYMAISIQEDVPVVSARGVRMSGWRA